MRSLLAFVILISFSIAGRAAEYRDGYIVMPNNDTVKCKFKVGGLILSTSFTRIIITDDQGEEHTFRGKDKKILGYGFIEKGRRYDYFYIETKVKSESGFYQRIVNGAKYKLYVHVVASYGSGINVGQPQYVLFNPAGEYEKFESCVLCSWKKQLRQLLKDDPKALDLLENASRLDIPKFVVDINRA